MAQDTEDKTPQTLRRQFVKRSLLALPAVMTLRNGHALAMASTVRCVRNGADPILNQANLYKKYNPMVKKETPVFVVVNDQGKVINESFSPAFGGQIVTQSCYNSVLPTA